MFSTRIDALWRAVPDCTKTAAASLSDRIHGEYVDIFVIGACDASFIKFAVQQYQRSRDFVDICLATHRSTQALANALGWGGYIAYERQYMHLMKQIDGALTDKGYVHRKARSESRSIM